MISGLHVAISPHSWPVRLQRQHFDGGKTGKDMAVGEGSKLYELNVWAVFLGLGKDETVQVQAELVARCARREH